MLLEKLKEMTGLSPAEQNAARWLLESDADLLLVSIRDAAAAMHISPSGLTRMAQKMGLAGWPEMRKKLTEEKNSQFAQSEIDASYPFEGASSVHSILNSITLLEQKTIEQTRHTLSASSLLQAARLIARSHRLYIFGMADTAACAETFRYKMRGIFRPVFIISNRDDIAFTLETAGEQDCCLFLSCSGQTFSEMGFAKMIQNCPVPTIGLSSEASQTLDSLVQIVLKVPDLENRYDTMGAFSSAQALHFAFDVLYALVFSLSYSENKKRRRDYYDLVDKPLIRK